MLNKRHNSVITLSILLTLVGLSKPAKAFLLAQVDVVQTTFTVPEELPQNTKVGIAASNSTTFINQGLKDGFSAKYPNTAVNVETQSAEDALNDLIEGNTDLVSIGRNLTTEEKEKGLVTVPISREKIAIVISKDNPYQGNLTFAQFAKIFRGEITDWSEIGGDSGAIQLVDLPESNDTRQAFPNYSVFQEGDFSTGSNTIQVDEDSTDAMISQLGSNGIGYAVAGDVIDRDDVKVVTMHQTLPDDPRYPFSQPFNLVYQGTPNEATSAFLGFATTKEGQETLAQRVGSISTVQTAQADSNAGDTDKTAQADSEDNGKLNPGVEDSGNPNIDVEDSGKLNPDLGDSGEINPDLDGSGDLDVDKIKGSGEVNPDLEGSGELNPDLEDSGTLNSDANLVEDGNAEGNPNSETNTGVGTTPNPETNADGDKGIAVAAKKNWWWWLPLIIGIPLLGALAYKFARGKEKSDQEPAIADLSNPNIPQGNADGFDPDLDGDNIKVGTAIGNVATETVSKGSKLGGAAIATGGAAIAGGAAAINKIGGINKGEKNIDVDPDIELENLVAQPETNIDASLNEIPSDPVSEFKGQETTFQPTEQSTKLQSDNLESDSSGLVDNISSIGGVAAVGGTAAAATGFLDNDNDIVEDESDASKIDSEVSNHSDSVSEQSTTLQTDDNEEQIYTGGTVSSNEDSDNIESSLELTNLEFEGDYVLDEEDQSTEIDSVDDEISWVDSLSGNQTSSSAQTFASNKSEAESSDIENSVVDQGSSLVDDANQTGGAEIAGGAAAIGGVSAAASSFFSDSNQGKTTEIDSIENSDTAIDTNWGENIDNSATTSSAQAFVLETPDVPSTDSQDTKIEQASGFIDDADQTVPDSDIGVSNNAFSGFSGDNERTEQTTEIGFGNTNIDDTNWVDETDDNETTSSAQAFVLDTPDVPSQDSQDTITDQTSGFMDNATQTGNAALAGGAAAIGGAAAAASGFFSNRKEEPTPEVDEIDDVNWVDDVNLDFNDEAETLLNNSEDNLENITNSADVSLEDITFDNANSSSEGNLENITFDEFNHRRQTRRHYL